MLGQYILDENGDPKVCNDTLEWGTWFSDYDKRRIASDHVGDVHVSTIFLGLDHNWSDDGPPILWETMIFGGKLDGYQQRYSSKKEAIEGHKFALFLVEQEPKRKFKLEEEV